MDELSKWCFIGSSSSLCFTENTITEWVRLCWYVQVCVRTYSYQTTGLLVFRRNLNVVFLIELFLLTVLIGYLKEDFTVFSSNYTSFSSYYDLKLTKKFTTNIRWESKTKIDADERTSTWRAFSSHEHHKFNSEYKSMQAHQLIRLLHLITYTTNNYHFPVEVFFADIS